LNIFYLDECPQKAARMVIWLRHVVKMPIESAQLLSNVVHKYVDDSGRYDIYAETHKNHPCSLWALQSSDNIHWLVSHAVELCAVYSENYNKAHKSLRVIELANDILFDVIFPKNTLTPVALAMPELYKSDDPVLSYRKYYLLDKFSKIDDVWTNYEAFNFWPQKLLEKYT
jgi:hypothetical protein